MDKRIGWNDNLNNLDGDEREEARRIDQTDTYDYTMDSTQGRSDGIAEMSKADYRVMYERLMPQGTATNETQFANLKAMDSQDETPEERRARVEKSDRAEEIHRFQSAHEMAQGLYRGLGSNYGLSELRENGFFEGKDGTRYELSEDEKHIVSTTRDGDRDIAEIRDISGFLVAHQQAELEQSVKLGIHQQMADLVEGVAGEKTMLDRLIDRGEGAEWNDQRNGIKWTVSEDRQHVIADYQPGHDRAGERDVAAINDVRAEVQERHDAVLESRAAGQAAYDAEKANQPQKPAQEPRQQTTAEKETLFAVGQRIGQFRDGTLSQDQPEPAREFPNDTFAADMSKLSRKLDQTPEQAETEANDKQILADRHEASYYPDDGSEPTLTSYESRQAQAEERRVDAIVDARDEARELGIQVADYGKDRGTDLISDLEAKGGEIEHNGAAYSLEKNKLVRTQDGETTRHYAEEVSFGIEHGRDQENKPLTSQEGFNKSEQVLDEDGPEPEEVHEAIEEPGHNPNDVINLDHDAQIEEAEEAEEPQFLTDRAEIVATIREQTDDNRYFAEDGLYRLVDDKLIYEDFRDLNDSAVYDANNPENEIKAEPFKKSGQTVDENGPEIDDGESYSQRFLSDRGEIVAAIREQSDDNRYFTDHGVYSLDGDKLAYDDYRDQADNAVYDANDPTKEIGEQGQRGSFEAYFEPPRGWPTPEGQKPLSKEQIVTVLQANDEGQGLYQEGAKYSIEGDDLLEYKLGEGLTAWPLDNLDTVVWKQDREGNEQHFDRPQQEARSSSIPETKPEAPAVGQAAGWKDAEAPAKADAPEQAQGLSKDDVKTGLMARIQAQKSEGQGGDWFEKHQSRENAKEQAGEKAPDKPEVARAKASEQAAVAGNAPSQSDDLTKKKGKGL